LRRPGIILSAGVSTKRVHQSRERNTKEAGERDEFGGGFDGRGDMELTRAYAILGVGDETSLDDVRTAFVTWWYLYSGSPMSEAPEVGHALSTEDWDDPATMLALHELDMAWHAIEQAHVRGSIRTSRKATCEECGSGPATRVTFTRLKAAGLRARTEVTSSVLCRDCGLDAFRAIEGTKRPLSLTAPLLRTRVSKRNAHEARTLRQIDVLGSDVVDASAALGDPPRLSGKRLVPWLTGLAAILLAIGIAVPAAGSGGSAANTDAPPAGQQPQASAATHNDR
jgi:hypothetical protein